MWGALEASLQPPWLVECRGEVVFVVFVAGEPCAVQVVVWAVAMCASTVRVCTRTCVVGPTQV
jgi:hypothetical protein